MKTAKDLRKQLKDELGLNSRQVSVRSDSCSIHVTIKVPAPKSPIEAIAKTAESIDRCEYSGEILSGGNTYVSVTYAEGILESYAKSVLGESVTAEVVEALKATPGKTLELPGGYDVFYLDIYYHVTKVGHSDYPHPTRTYGGREALNLYAERLLEDRAAAS